MSQMVNNEFVYNFVQIFEILHLALPEESMKEVEDYENCKIQNYDSTKFDNMILKNCQWKITSSAKFKTTKFDNTIFKNCENF